MAVNGIEIQLGQKWRMRDGEFAVVSEHRPEDVKCWVMRAAPKDRGDMPVWAIPVTDEGTDDICPEYDLVHLVEDVPSPASPTLGSNRIQITLGSKWLMRDGTPCTVVGEKPGLLYPWIIEWDSSDTPTRKLRDRVNGEGRENAVTPGAHDLVARLASAWDGHEALTFAPLAGSPDPANPKDAIGATKLPVGLVPDTVSILAAMAFAEGASKYGAYNWRASSVRMSIYLEAMRRHQMKLWNGEWADKKTTVPHLASIIACAGIIEDARLCGKLVDDRPPAVDLEACIAEAEAIIKHVLQLNAHMHPKNWTQTAMEVPQ